MMNPFKKIKDLETRIVSLEHKSETIRKIDALSYLISNQNLDFEVRTTCETKLKQLLSEL